MLKSVYPRSDCFKSVLVASSVACHGMFSSVWLDYLQVRLFQHVATLQVFSDPSFFKGTAVDRALRVGALTRDFCCVLGKDTFF